MRLRLVAAAAVVVSLALGAATAASRARQHRRRRRRQRSASGCRSTPRTTGRAPSPPRRSVRSAASRRRRQGRVPDLGRPPDEVRRRARGQQRAGRDRARQHRDDEVHGGRSASPTSPRAKRSIPNSRTWLQGLTDVGHLQGQALRRPVLRGRARRHLPHRPVQAGRRQGAPTSLDQFEAAGEEADGEVRQGPALLGALLPGPVLVRVDVLRLRLRRRDRRASGTASGTARSTRRRRSQALTSSRQIVLAHSRASKTVDEANPQQALVFAQGQGRLVHRQRLGVGLRARHEAGQPDARGQDRRVPDAEPHEGQVHADVPRRLRPRRPGHEQEQGAGGRLDQGLHRHRPRCASIATAGKVLPNTTSLATSTAEQPRSRRSRRLRGPAGSCRRRRTGRTSRAPTSPEHARLDLHRARQTVQPRRRGRASRSRRS